MSAKLTEPGIGSGAIVAEPVDTCDGATTTCGVAPGAAGEIPPFRTMPTRRPTLAVSAAVSHARLRVMTRSL